MSIQRWGALAALTEAVIYLFGFIWFFAVLDPSGGEETTCSVAPCIDDVTTSLSQSNIAFMINHQDSYFLGYLVCGILFSFVLIILVQALYRRFKHVAPELMSFATTVGYLWAAIVLASSLIFLTSLEAIVQDYSVNAEQAMTIYQSVSIVIDALGGGIELVGALWVLLVSYVGLKYRIFYAWVHFWGIVVGISGVLTLFSGLSFLSTLFLFEMMTAIFGLGQIVWFIALGCGMLMERGSSSSVIGSQA
ncbi:DUF4386 family protein [uncultured Shewanella sp.]|uniref:DUF4386 family protein n=1 Tax=uncultured Shewanella sp. TaxID=173975 RepID=UPI002620EC83|nr:DUF4386 family protein [uncultured Shewanella sp.]